jgi:indolepyruvate ferredoxin oxidoreductase, alpha subunit
MKSLGDVLLTADPFSEIVMGDTAIVRAMAESGVKVVSSYPGSPTPEIADAILSIPLEKRPFYFEFSVNEKVATEVAYGASIQGNLSVVFFKSVGMNVALDSLVQLSMMELMGGMVIVLGDDPGANSSQNEQDNRHLCRLSYLPLLEPATPNEVYSMFKEAVRISTTFRMPVALRLTTHVCHAKEKVSFGSLPASQEDFQSIFDPANGPYVPITSAVFPLKRKALQKLDQVLYDPEAQAVELIARPSVSKGVICSGFPYLSLRESMLNAKEPLNILKLNRVYPLPEKEILAFFDQHQEVKVLEELDDSIEKDILAFAYQSKTLCKIIGKQDLEDSIGEYTPEKVNDIMHKTWPELFPKTVDPIEDRELVTPRPPQMCPGCGHRSAFYAVKKALPPETITVADIGCHSLGFLKPYEMGQMLLSMGHCTGTAAGLSLGNKTRPVVAFIGDSTFFHAGLPGIINAIYNQHHLTLIVMENGTTAMTGHQGHPGSGGNVRGEAPKISIRKVLEAFGVESIEEIDTYQQAELTEMVKKAIATPGFKVIIARHPCMLKFMRDRRRKGEVKINPVEVDQNICNQLFECIDTFACPTFQRTPEGKIVTQHDLCIGDQSCVAVCPSKALGVKEEKTS